ncbi:MAG TPA: hypothetical protein VFO80_06390, partial [Sphingomonas sp.]|nr:hypothetical protein [Sphingomonas sp.]
MFVIPAQTGIHSRYVCDGLASPAYMDSRLRGSDDRVLLGRGPHGGLNVDPSWSIHHPLPQRPRDRRVVLH